MGVPHLWPPLNRPPLADPNQLDYLVTFKHFCEHLRSTQPASSFDDEELQKRYAIYKENFAARQLAAFYDRHHTVEWFAEKYHPVRSVPRAEEARALRRRLYDRFVVELEAGKFDEVDFDEPENAAMTRKEWIKKEEEGGEDEAKAEGEEHGVDAAGDAKMEQYMKIDGVEQGNETVTAEQHTYKLIIKTVPPSISRKKIITMCQEVEGFEYLALSEPSPTKKFHRIGWIAFKEGTDMQAAYDKLNNKKIDDFVFHLAMHKHQPPSRTRVAPEIAATPDRLAHDLERVRRVAQVADADLGDQVDGYNLVHSRAQKVIEQRLRKRAEEDHLRVQTLADQGDDAEMEREEGEGDAEDGENESRAARERRRELEDDVWETKKQLDLFIQYLRRVHLFCYYCGSESDSIEELQRKCVDHHWRKRVAVGMTVEKGSAGKSEKSVAQWAKNLDQKIEMKIRKPTEKEIERMGGKTIESEIENFMRDFVHKEHDARYKCKIAECKKAFKGYEFVEKHIRHKHPEKFEKLEEDVLYFNNYVCDPNHLLPTTPPNPSSAAALNAAAAMQAQQQTIVSPLPILPGVLGAPPTVLPYGIPPLPIGANGAPLRIPHGFLPMQGAAPGTPFDQIPRIGFHEGGGGWAPMMGNRRLDNRQLRSTGNGNAGGRSSGAGAGGRATGGMQIGSRMENDLPLNRDLPRDPRQVKSYVDLDAPAEGDIDLNYG
ncbi:hypothetical protein BC936DRAFT_137496 [Jimgerdemannia flammicorona]|uniref:C2H2-type domain-containing protein n=1 Tax=Jimgerdemannia flammicorona TaxID=994334 RepID=A0A433CX77_9FUNG|nr:hypothetical protein BC936DRAFT_137496 [Jimgerdemannia flammicorona]